MHNISRKYHSIIALFLILMVLIPTSLAENKHISPARSKQNNGTILFVGGTGPNNYTRIQDAIDNATNNDAIYIFQGTYYENIIIDKQLYLIGENKDTVIIDGFKQKNTVTIKNNASSLTNLSIVNAYGNAIYVAPTADRSIIENISITSTNTYGIFIDGSDNTYLLSNDIHDCCNGIYLCNATENTQIMANQLFKTHRAITLSNQCHYNTIKNNYITNSSVGITILDTYFGNYLGNNTVVYSQQGIMLQNATANHLETNNIAHTLIAGITLKNHCSGNYLRDNILYNNTKAIDVNQSEINAIRHNNITDNIIGIQLHNYSSNNLISANIIKNNILGVQLIDYSKENQLFNNNIKSNTLGIYLINRCDLTKIYENNFKTNSIDAFYSDSLATWNNNYWDRPRFLPKTINGELIILNQVIPTKNYDREPAKKPWPLIEHLEPTQQYSLPDYVQRGDIVLMDLRSDSGVKIRWYIPGSHNDHAALYLGNSLFIGASSKGVRIANYADFHINFEDFAFIRVISANTTQIQQALSFALGRLGALYQIFFSPPYFGRKINDPTFPHPTANLWYCMELPWAAYYNQGIDIDRNGWYPCPQLAWVIGNDIISDDDCVLLSDEE